MKYIFSLLTALAAFSVNAANYTQVQVGAGAMHFGLHDRSSQEFKDNGLQNEERTKPSISLQISGQILEKSKALWFDMFAQQTANYYAEYQEEGQTETEVEETNFTIFGLGARLMVLPGYMFQPYLKTGYFTGKIRSKSTIKQPGEESYSYNSTVNETGYYAGGGAMQRINSKNSVSLDYAAYKVEEIKNFQHNFQIGWVFHF